MGSIQIKGQISNWALHMSSNNKSKYILKPKMLLPFNLQCQKHQIQKIYMNLAQVNVPLLSCFSYHHRLLCAVK